MSILAKGKIFSQLHEALADVTNENPEESPITWQYDRPSEIPGDIVDYFLQPIAGHKAEAEWVAVADLLATIVRHLHDIGAKSMILPADLDSSWRAAIEVGDSDVRNDDNLTARKLSEIDTVATAAAVGVANTETFAMDHRPDQGRQTLTLVPDAHICVVYADQVVSNTPEATARLQTSIKDCQPITFMVGPSATSDIEPSRMEGAYDPRILHVIVVDQLRSVPRNSEPLTATAWGSVVWSSIVVMVLVLGLACAVRAGNGCGYCLDNTPALIS